MMSNLIDSRVEMLHECGAIVDPRRFVRIMSRPVRPVWISDGTFLADNCHGNGSNNDDIGDGDDDGSSRKAVFSTIVCCNPSRYLGGYNRKDHVSWQPLGDDGDPSSPGDGIEGESGYYYTPGAADDEDSWGRGLTPELFWRNRDVILAPARMDDETDAAIDEVVKRQQINNNDGGGRERHRDTNSANADKIGDLNLWIGTRRAGRPPECWDDFDAVLNVTEEEYPNTQQSIQQQSKNGEYNYKACYYLQLPVAEGKNDKTELQRWMPVGLVFLAKHLRHDRRVLGPLREGTGSLRGRHHGLRGVVLSADVSVATDACIR